MEITKFEDFDDKDINEYTKFIKTPNGKMVPIGRNAQNSTFNITKQEWNNIYDAINKFPLVKKQELMKKLHELGLL